MRLSLIVRPPAQMIVCLPILGERLKQSFAACRTLPNCFGLPSPLQYPHIHGILQSGS